MIEALLYGRRNKATTRLYLRYHHSLVFLSLKLTISSFHTFVKQYDAQITHAKLVSEIQGNYTVSLNEE